MALHIIEKYFDAVLLLQPDVYADERGFFMEQYRSDYFEQFGIHERIVQENHSGSQKNVVRGMHFQWDKPMGKLLRVIRGSIQLVEIDIRYNSPTVGKYCSFHLSDVNRRMVWIPPGFANGFAALSDFVEVQYLCTAIWNPQGEGAIAWNDDDVHIEWEVDAPIVSEKDMKAQSLSSWLKKPESRLFSL